MKISCWAATALATPAIATGVCLWTATTAQAAPDDTSTSASASSAGDSSDSDSTDSSSSRSESRSTTKLSRTQDRSQKADDASSEDATSDDDLAEADAADDDTDTVSGPHYAPSRISESDDDVLLNDDDDDEVVDDTDEDEDTDEPEAVQPVGERVEKAITQLGEARDQLREVTWGDGNVLAGLAAIIPQMMLGGAQTNLERWMANHERLQQEFAATVDEPFAHMIARLRLENSIQQPLRAGDQMDAAEKLLKIVGWFGPRDATGEISALVELADENGTVYSVLPMEMWRRDGTSVRTEPVVYVSVNGGPRVPVLLDTGSVGLVMDPRYIGLEDLGEPGPTREGGYGDTFTYDYNVYRTSIEFDGDLVIDETDVKVVALYSAAGFEEYNRPGGYVGVLGVGTNSQTEDWDTNPMVDLPGVLSSGMMIDERRRRVILGPNPYPARVTVDYAPDTPLTVKVGGRQATHVPQGTIDSGGIFGEVPGYLWPEEEIPAGTLIEVYTADGETLLYSYRTTRANNPEVSEGSLFNTGFVPFSQTSIYVTYSGDGTTTFNYR